MRSKKYDENIKVSEKSMKMIKGLENTTCRKEKKQQQQQQQKNLPKLAWKVNPYFYDLTEWPGTAVFCPKSCCTADQRKLLAIYWKETNKKVNYHFLML